MTEQEWIEANPRPEASEGVARSYLGVMREMIRSGESEGRMREFAARAYAHEARVRALIAEMANDCRRFAEGT